MKPLRVLIVGTGNMANDHAKALGAIPGVEIVAGVDTRPEQLAEFCKKHAIAHGFASVEEAVGWGAFDAVSNVTPDRVHYPTTMPLLAAGKHVLCEKPLATRADDAEDMARAAAHAGVVNMINLTYRRVPALQQAARMIRRGDIGRLRHFEASYLQSWLTQPAWGDWKTESEWLWRLSTAHGSKGVLGDVGVHILDFVTFAAGQSALDVSCRLVTFDKADGGRIGDYVLDANDSATMQIRLEDGALGTVTATRFASGHLNDLSLRIHGDLGGLEVTWRNDQSHLRACLGSDMTSATWRDVDCPPVRSVYQCFVDAIHGSPTPDLDFAHGARLQRLLERAEQSALQQGIILPL